MLTTYFLVVVSTTISLLSPEAAPPPLSLDLLSKFSSKTAYRNSRLSEARDQLWPHGACSLVHVTALFRHGTRSPGSRDMRRVVQVHRKILASASKSKLPDDFVKWKSPFSLDKDKALTLVGFEEMERLGQIFKSYLDSIDGFKDYKKHIKTYSSSLSRTKLSAVTFLMSFFGGLFTEEELNDLITEDDGKLRFFDFCPHYTNSVLKDKSSKKEFTNFLKGLEIQKAIEDIKRKWELNDVDLSPDDLKTLYIMCGFEIATNLSSSMKPDKCPNLTSNDDIKGCPYEPMFNMVETSPLCSILEPLHFDIFEYLYDLKHYWTKSYGKEINWVQSCPLMSSMFDPIFKASRGHQAAVRAAAVSRRPLEYYLDQQDHLRSGFWFGHAETLIPIITLLNLFNQSTPMFSSSFQERLSSVNDPLRRFSTFRVSNISPFAGNIALELYHCPHLAKGDSNGYRIQVKCNEKAVSWPLAGEERSHTSLESFVKHIGLCLPEKYYQEAVCKAQVSGG